MTEYIHIFIKKHDLNAQQKPKRADKRRSQSSQRFVLMYNDHRGQPHPLQGNT